MLKTARISSCAIVIWITFTAFVCFQYGISVNPEICPGGGGGGGLGGFMTHETCDRGHHLFKLVLTALRFGHL